MSTQPGTRLGPYEIVAPLGAGGMGEVYRARDSRLERDVAIKVLPQGTLVDEAARHRFKREALALAKVNHPNIATVYDVGEQDGRDFLVMEYVAGETLAEKLKSGPLPAKEAIALGAEIADALDESHARGVVHRDLKPGNIIVTTKGHAKVLDFGLAKLFTPEASEDGTLSYAETRGPVGTPRYMSPEQAEGKLLDARSDLWSLGVVLYESMSGKAPFQGSSQMELLRAISEKAPKPLRRASANIPECADRIVSRALEKDASRRYQSASEMALELTSALNQLSGTGAAAATEKKKRFGARTMGIAAIAMVIVGGGTWRYREITKRQWAIEKGLPEIVKLQNDGKPLAAFLLMQAVRPYAGENGQFASIAADLMTNVSIASEPNGATVEIQDYLSPNGPWHKLGTTPLQNAAVPKGYFRWRISKDGSGEYRAAPATASEMKFSLDEEKKAPAGMVWVDGGVWEDMMAFVGWIGPYQMPAFYIDRYEVTNRQYQEFVDKGGYQRKEFWNYEFRRGGKTISWEEGMALLRDRTGRAGPATWEAGHFDEGQGDFPVSGVSWYEAAAYAEFAGKRLPALSQWMRASPPDLESLVVPQSNISRTGLAAVGSFQGVGPYGTYDMTGNVREWIANTSNEGHYFALGGSWKSPSYMSADPEALDPFDRSATNGFRCVRNTGPLSADITAPIKEMNRDFLKAKPATDAVFRVLEAEYSYQRTPLNAKEEGVVQETADWRQEKITFDAAYGGERLAGYLFLPKKIRPPYQTVIFFPSARVLDIPNSSTLGDTQFFDYIVQSGRAVFYPVLQDTYERRFKHGLPGIKQDREVTLDRYKDLGRSLDYMATRTDINMDKIAYLGVSMGAAEGVIYATLLQDRLKAVVFLDGGYFLNELSAGMDQVDFTPRLKKPVLMVNGRYDFVFSLEKSQEPFFRMLGTPESDRKHIVMDSGHDVTGKRTELVTAVLGWLDKYLGRPE
ncbi:MAG TPA: protein kinase [Candidatus Acidoferrum sp.]|nr:protein kinase [Candidatus Acidoferrum sp.]